MHIHTRVHARMHIYPTYIRVHNTQQSPARTLHIHAHKQDEQEAIRFLHMAADAGHKAALSDLSVCYSTGWAVQVDEMLGQDLYARASEFVHAPHMVTIACENTVKSTISTCREKLQGARGDTLSHVCRRCMRA